MAQVKRSCLCGVPSQVAENRQSVVRQLESNPGEVCHALRLGRPNCRPRDETERRDAGVRKS